MGPTINLQVKLSTRNIPRISRSGGDPPLPVTRGVPKQFSSKYGVPVEIVAALESLIARRRAIVHPKPYISINGDNRHKGNEPSIEMDEHEFIEKCVNLPNVLLDNLLAQAQTADTVLFSIRIYCGLAAQTLEQASIGRKLFLIILVN